MLKDKAKSLLCIVYRLIPRQNQTSLLIKQEEEVEEDKVVILKGEAKSPLYIVHKLTLRLN